MFCFLDNYKIVIFLQMCNSYSFEFQKNSYFLRRFEVSRVGCPGKPVAARGLVNGRDPRRQAWEGWSGAEGLQGTLPANDN